MKTFCKTTLLAGLLLAVSNLHPAQAATLILSDSCNVTGSGSGFALNTGINTGINPPTTRLTGTAAPGLRYINTGTKATTNYTMLNNRMRVGAGANPGRFVLSSNGTTAFDFGPALGISAASPGSPEVYDLSVNMKNTSTGTQRFSFALGSAEGDATTWDFGFQVYRNAAGDNFYTIGKRIDTGASGLGSDLNSTILTMGAGTFGTEITVLMRVTDAGAETTTFNSRVQLSLNGGSTWFYDTATDANLTSGWRLDGAARIIMMDIAPDAGDVTYDNFTVTWNSGPRTWSGAGANGNWSNATNWGGATPVNGSALIFNGTTRQVNTNDLTGLNASKVIFNNGGFTLYGNTFTNSGTGITNLAGNNILKAGLSWSSTSAKTWNVASGSELMLSNTTTIGVIGDHSVVGGGTLRTKGTMNFTANPVFAVNEGKHIVDGGVINTIGGYRIGSQATGAGAQTILTNGASLTITATGGNLRVGDSANPVTARLDMDSSTLTLSGGVLLAVPYATGAIGTVTQTGGTVSPGILSFSEGGAGNGSYTVKNGTLITKQIRENTSGGSASIYFDNATLRTDTGAVSAFMTGLDLAQISTGGLSFDVLSDITVGQVLSGTGALTKTGGAVLQLNGTGANTYSGVTTVNAGTLLLAKTAGVNAIPGNVTVGDGVGGAGADILRLGAANQIPDTTAVTISASGLFDLNGFSETVASVSSASSASQIALGAGTLTTGDAGAATYAGSISGTGSLVKQGAGTLTLNGASTYSGTATVNAGVVNVQNATALGTSGATVVSSGAALEVQGGIVISGEPLTLNGTGVSSGGALRNVSGNNSSSGAVTLGSATKIQSDSGTLTLSGGIGGSGQNLTVGGAGNTTVSSAITTGAGTLTKADAGTLTLSGANTFTGNTTINAGTLALGIGGSLASSMITLSSGATYNVSAISGYALTGSQTLARDSASGAGNINGSITLNSGAQISLQANGTFGTLSVTGGLTVNANVITINVAGSALGAGTYTLITYTGTKTGSFNATPTITGSGIGTGLVAKIVESAGTISLNVSASGHGIAAANVKVVENDLANTTNSVTVSTTISINGLGVRAGSSRGDYTVQVGTTGTDDLTNGVLMTSVAENGRDNGEDAGIQYCTSSISFTSGGYFIPTASAPDGAEYNINVAAAYFPYARYLGGYARNAGGTNGPNNLLTASPGLVLGTHFIDHGDGTSTVNLTSLGINSQTDGVLLTTAGGNDNKYASVEANVDGTWTLLVKDNGTNGSPTTQGPVAFAFVPKANTAVVSGKFQGDGTILMYSGSTPAFSVTNTTNGTWKLTIPGYSPSTGVLVISAEGGTGLNIDNIVSSQPSGSDWLIQSRDLPGLGLQALTEPVVSFVFIPGPIATLVSPANKANISSAPNLTVTATSPAGGNLSVSFSGHRLAVPGPGPDFLICVLPDTQNYAREDSANGQATKEMWYSQTDWIVNHRDSDNIAYVQQLGDIVQNGDILNGNPNDGEWEIATNAMYRLEKQSTTQRLEGIPYSCVVGNHDQEPNGDLDGTTTHYNQYFGISHFTGKSYYGGHYDVNNDNHFELFSAGGLDFLVICFEFDRYGSLVIDWAQSVIDAHPNRRIIFATHYIGSDSTPCSMSDSADAFYTAFKANTNFFLMLGGHVFNNGGEGSRSDTFGGHTVHTLVSDYQGRFNGGNGLMRQMYFSPSNNIVNIKTFSPYTGLFETDSDSQFSFTYNMQPNGAGVAGTSYSTLATTTNVVPGAQTSFNWTGLTANRTYQWYVTVTAANGDYSTSPEWTFNTTAGYSGLVAPPDTDANGNGLPDAWEAKYGVSNPSADDDHDGQSNRAEYLAGTNPTNASSFFHILDAKQGGNGHVTLHWSSVGGVRYRVQYSDGAGRPFVDIVREEAEETDVHPSGEEATNAYTDTLAPTNGIRFYRIKVVH